MQQPDHDIRAACVKVRLVGCRADGPSIARPIPRVYAVSRKLTAPSGVSLTPKGNPLVPIAAFAEAEPMATTPVVASLV